MSSGRPLPAAHPSPHPPPCYKDTECTAHKTVYACTIHTKTHTARHNLYKALLQQDDTLVEDLSCWRRELLEMSVVGDISGPCTLCLLQSLTTPSCLCPWLRVRSGELPRACRIVVTLSDCLGCVFGLFACCNGDLHYSLVNPLTQHPRNQTGRKLLGWRPRAS